MRKIIKIWFLTLAACSSPAVGTDAGASVDGKLIDAPRGLTATPITCAQYTRTTIGSDGSQTVVEQYYAMISGIAPTDDYFIETTTVAYPPIECPSGATCTDVGMPPPPGGSYWSHRSGQFLPNGKLMTGCGSRYFYFNASGALTAEVDYRTTVTLHR